MKDINQQDALEQEVEKAVLACPELQEARNFEGVMACVGLQMGKRFQVKGPDGKMREFEYTGGVDITFRIAERIMRAK